MTLSDVHDNPEVLARYLGVPFNTEPTGGIAPADLVTMHWRNYRRDLEAAWAVSAQNPYRYQTWGQFLAECLREGLGIRKAGKLADRLTYATMARPDLYRAA